MKRPRLTRSEIAVLVVIVIAINALLLPSATSGYTCSQCGNDIVMKQYFSWRVPGLEMTRRCLTRRPITADCRHPPFGAGAVVVERNGFPVAGK